MEDIASVISIGNETGDPIVLKSSGIPGAGERASVMVKVRGCTCMLFSIRSREGRDEIN